MWVWTLAAGCYTGSARDASPERIASEPGWQLVRGVPFVAQRGGSDCGAAALAMVLTQQGMPTSRDEVLAQIPPRDGGVTAGELRDFARRRGAQAFVVPGAWDDLERQLQRGRPLLVGLAKPMLGGRAAAHFEVVIGFH